MVAAAAARDALLARKPARPLARALETFQIHESWYRGGTSDAYREAGKTGQVTVPRSEMVQTVRAMLR